ncbi:phosphoribosylformylglycinamidine synthase [Acetonema longum]|uniref:Phosphoribosylformylglycinamidine synthase n=1 Tax=Acetonema longum DSM 6540 TaxID=1009370 RepID=F7NI22_9FIRM|nr:phosphoribosylformylglycinamidine synthase [Acetonema longum]EGO64329.1 phosphoribosylformylglycinamidine synthase [Acetonema longum DSM 6540]
MSNHSIRRVYVEKKPGFDVEARNLFGDLKTSLAIPGLQAVRIINRYDISGLTDEQYQAGLNSILAEPPVDRLYEEEFIPAPGEKLFAMEYLPGQYDQRADSAAQCFAILAQREQPAVHSAKLIVLAGGITDAQLDRIKAYCINPVESREAALDKPASLELDVAAPPDVAVISGFIRFDTVQMTDILKDYALAMSASDLAFCQKYFRDTEQRDPTLTEIRLIDTYWSDHCRHTTFFTAIEGVEIEPGEMASPIEQAYREYLAAREFVYSDGQKERAVTLMDIAVMGMKELKKRGKLQDLDESEEINAASIVVEADIDGRRSPWLVMFKNETHNHPTEIEPYGGAATCLGGAIRDPLSGRAYVYQAMRVTGSGDPRTPVEDTLPGKLPQRKITTGAAAGFSSYGNQIGLATGQVAELYHPGFVAKRMEVGAVIGAAPRDNVRRERPAPGDVVLLLGGRTGRDGCGGATGSSKEHTAESLFTCGSEVQKGNPPTERKIQRLFRDPAVSRLIKRCNDFGAGGVAVAIGELTDGIEVNLDAVPKKYEGLDGTELAISESQERMAVVVAAGDAAQFIAAARAENLEATIVASVTANRRLVMGWRGKTIVDISRDFLDTNGVQQKVSVRVASPDPSGFFSGLLQHQPVSPDLKAAWLHTLSDLNVCSQKGLGERFDSSIGAATVLMPFGGRFQDTPAEGMAAKLPVLNATTTTATVMTYGYLPQIGAWSPFHGAVYAVVEAVTKIVAMGGDYRQVRLTLQEYFEKLGQDPNRWGKPFAALLGAYHAQKQLGIPAIGGKDSMSGTFLDLDVPPTLVAFAVTPVHAGQVISPELKQTGSRLVLIPVERGRNNLPDFALLAKNYDKVHALVKQGQVLSAMSLRYGGLVAAVSKMCFGNRIGLAFEREMSQSDLFSPDYGSLLLELPPSLDPAVVLGDVRYTVLGRTQAEPIITINGQSILLDEAYRAWSQPLSGIFPLTADPATGEPPVIAYPQPHIGRPAAKLARPRVIIPVFPGTNCEYDSAAPFTQAGAQVDTLVIRNLTPRDIEETVLALASAIDRSQIVMLPGGFSAGDEPDGSGKFIAVMFRNPRIKEAVRCLLQQRDGLMLGICNGFQALVKLGLVPYGDIVDISPDMPTLTFNSLGRHISRFALTKVTSVLSPWLANAELGDIHSLPFSHGEGRFAASATALEKLAANGQIAAQYVDEAGLPRHDIAHNPNGSLYAVEAITSPDGRILGKMGHSERTGSYVAQNIPGNKDQGIFSAGVQYFR